MNTEVWLIVIGAAVGYAVQFGVIIGKLSALARDVEHIRNNDLHGIQSQLDALPCADHEARVRVLEET